MGVIADEAGRRREAMMSGVAWAKACIGEGAGYLSPRAALGSLSEFEWWKLGENLVSGWIAESVAQRTRERVELQDLAALMDGNPSPEEIGVITAVLPALGEWVARKGLTDLPIGQWPKEAVIQFAAGCANAAAEARVRRDERPTADPLNDAIPWLGA